MKKYSVWQKIQIIFCLLIVICVFAPLVWMAIDPARAAYYLKGILLEESFAAAVSAIMPMQRAIFGGLALIGLLCVIRIVVIMFSKKGKDRKGVALQNATDGPIHISIPAVETLVSQGIRDVPGLSDVRMKIYDYHDSISIEITMSARSDINIPDTMMRLQARIKAYVQESAGIEVREVRLNVDKVVLADGIQALPTGRMKRAGSSEQEQKTKADYQPQSFTWKENASEPEVETRTNPEPAAEEAPKAQPQTLIFTGNAAAAPEPEKPAAQPEAKPVSDDDDDDDEGRRGWFGRRNHHKKQEEAAPVAKPAPAAEPEAPVAEPEAPAAEPEAPVADPEAQSATVAETEPEAMTDPEPDFVQPAPEAEPEQPAAEPEVQPCDDISETAIPAEPAAMDTQFWGTPEGGDIAEVQHDVEINAADTPVDDMIHSAEVVPHEPEAADAAGEAEAADEPAAADVQTGDAEPYHEDTVIRAPFVISDTSEDILPDNKD